MPTSLCAVPFLGRHSTTRKVPQVTVEETISSAQKPSVDQSALPSFLFRHLGAVEEEEETGVTGTGVVGGGGGEELVVVGTCSRRPRRISAVGASRSIRGGRGTVGSTRLERPRRASLAG